LQSEKTALRDSEYKLQTIFDSILQNAKELFAKFNFAVQKIDNEIINKKTLLQNNLKELAFALDKIVSNYSTVLQNATNTMLNFQSVLERNKKQLVFLEKALYNHNPKRQLAMGYSITTDKTGKVVRSVKQVKKDDKINVQVADGRFKSKVESVKLKA